MMRKYKSGGAKKAKSGTKAKKMGYGGKAASMTPPKSKMKAKSGSTLKKAPAGSKGKGMRSLPKAVRNKIGFAKKGKAVKKCKSGCK
tara:strand:+ start:275 stop:535 length:261 start_codon:yes stop_codon:yes gene_type:complete